MSQERTQTRNGPLLVLVPALLTHPRREQGRPAQPYSESHASTKRGRVATAARAIVDVNHGHDGVDAVALAADALASSSRRAH